MTKNYLIKQANFQKIRAYFEKEYIRPYTYANTHQINITEFLKVCEKLGEHQTINITELIAFLKQYYSMVDVVTFLEGNKSNTYVLIRE